MKQACAQCGTTKFGLVRPRHYFLEFCSKRCKEKYLVRLAQERERLKSWAPMAVRLRIARTSPP
jgi:endogenous inhibitor of DNA gyrase (YacG/DUF329 family)